MTKPEENVQQGEVDIPVCHSPKRQTGMSAPRSEQEARFLSQTDMRSVNITYRRLPHWTCDAVLYWVTFRLADSLPQAKLRAWQAERDLWLKRNPKPWTDEQFQEYNLQFGDRLEAWLDVGYGSCALARPDVRAAVQKCLLRFDGERLLIHAAVIMPNHVHILMEPLADNKLSVLLKGIKGASARQANQLLGTTGTFWDDESFDHILRSEAQYWHLVNYVAENPLKAHLNEGQYWHYQNTCSEA